MNKRINQGLMETTLVFSVGGGIEHEAKIDVRYVVHPGRFEAAVSKALSDAEPTAGGDPNREHRTYTTSNGMRAA